MSKGVQLIDNVDREPVNVSFADITPNIRPVLIPDKPSTGPSVKRRQFGPYIPYASQVKLNVSVAVVLNKEKNSVNNYEDKDYVDFAVEETSAKNPRLVEHDELHVIELKNTLEKNHVENIEAKSDLTETTSTNLELIDTSDTFVWNNLSIKKELMEANIEDEIIFKEVRNGSTESSEVKNLQMDSEKNDSCLSTVRDEEILTNSATSSQCNPGLNQTSRPDQNMLSTCEKDLLTFAALFEKQSHLSNGRTKSTRFQAMKQESCRHFCEAYRVLPVSVKLVDVQLSKNFRHKYLLAKALQKLTASKINSNSPTPQKVCKEIINVSTDASSPVVCQSFEEAVALKLAEKRKLNGLTDSSKSPCTIQSKNDTVILTLSSKRAKKMSESLNDSSKDILETRKEFANKTLTSSDISNYNEMLAQNSCVIPRNDSIESRRNTLRSQLNATIQRITSPEKPYLSKRSCKTRSNLTLSEEMPLSQSISTDNPTDNKADADISDCQAVRTVPLHPRIRMKFKSHPCNCAVEHCSHRSPSKSPPNFRNSSVSEVIETSPWTSTSNLQSNSVSEIVETTPLKSTPKLRNSSVSEVIETNKSKFGDKRIIPTCNDDTPLVMSLPVASSPCCTIMNYSSVIRTPSMDAGKTFVFDQSPPSRNDSPSKNVSPSKRSNRASLLLTPSPKSSRSKLSWSINRSLLESEHHQNIKQELEEKEDLVALDSDTLTASSCEDLKPTVVHISSDSEMDIENGDERESFFVPVLKRESDVYDTRSEMDDDDYIADILPGERRQRKISSKKRIESFIVKPKIAPTLLKTSDIGEMDVASNSTGRLVKTVSKRQMMKLSRYFKLQRVIVTAIKLNETTIQRLIKLCTVRKIWNNPELLANAGLSSYDIQRLFLSKLRSQSNSKYGFRKFLKRTDVFQSLSEKPKLTMKSKREEYYLKSQRKKMREMMLAREREEKKRQDVESIRRSLLKINAKFLNQSKFWSFLDQGTPGKPIKL